MNKILKHKRYIGSIEVSLEDNCLHGKLLFVNDLVTYEASDPQALEDEFKAAVDDYIETCEQIGKEPDKPFSGSFNVRIEPELHKDAAIKAKILDISLNEIVKVALEDKLAKESKVHHLHNHVHHHISERSITFDVNQGESECQTDVSASLRH